MLGYVIAVISPTTSYVLLAANIDDFRIIAKRLVPNHMASVNYILNMARDAANIDQSQENATFIYKSHHKDTSTKAIPLDIYVETESKPKSKKNRKHKSSKPTTQHFELNLDELVEKVKEKLKAEFKQTPPAKSDEKLNTEGVTSKHGVTKDKKEKTLGFKKRKVKDVEQSNDDIKTSTDKSTNQSLHNISNAAQGKHKKGRPIDKRYLADVFVAKPPKYLLEYGKTYKTTKTTEAKKTSAKYTREHTKNTEPTESMNKVKGDLYVGYDLRVANDSYEDYFTPKKDLDYKEPATEETSPKIKKNIVRYAEVKHQQGINDKKLLDVFSDNEKTTSKTEDGIDYNHKTLDYNEKKNIIRNDKDTLKEIPIATEDTSIIKPYSQQLESLETFNENDNIGTEQSFSISEIVFLTDAEEKSTQKTPNKNINKSVRKPKKATLIPKRDFYKISTPNYLLEMPIIGERYRFDEPIPEEDRDQENLKYIGNPPASINGKTGLSV